MKFSTNSKVLAKALDSVSTALPLKTTMPILNCILFERDARGQLSLTASDLDNTIIERVPVQFHDAAGGPPMRIAAPSAYLLQTVRNLGDVPVEFEFMPHFSLNIKTDQGKYTMSGHDGGDFPAAPKLEAEQHQFEISRELLAKAVEKASFAVSKQKARSAMSGILFQLEEDHLRIVGTDSLRLVMFKCLGVPCSETLKTVVPATALKGISRLSGGDSCKVTVDKKHTSFDFGTSTLIARIIDAPFPSYERVIPKNNDRTIRVERELFWAAARRISLFAGSNAKQVRLDIDSDSLKISAEDIERAHSAFETIPCEFTDIADGSGKLTMAYSSAYLLGVLQHLESHEVIFEVGDPNRAGTVRPSANEPGVMLMMLLMPVMLSTYV